MSTKTTTEEVELSTFDDRPHRQEPIQATSTTNDEPSYPTGVKFAVLTLGLVLSIFLSALDTTILATAIPSITDQFGTIANIAWYGTAYGISNTSFKSAWGKAYGLFPLKPTLLVAIAIFETGNVLCATSQSSQMLIFGRVVAGLGGGGVMSGCFIIIALTSPPRLRAAYMGILGVTFGCASVAGPLMGGTLTDTLGWRWCFWISLPIGGLAAGIMTFALTQPSHHIPAPLLLRERVKRMDLGGGLLVTAAFCSFVLAMERGGKHSWASAPVILSLVGAAASGALFVLNEYKMGPKAMLPIQFFRNKIVVTNFVFIFLLAGLFFPLLYSLPIHFQSINNQTAAQSGMRLIPIVMGVSVFTMIANAILTFAKGFYNPFMTCGSLLGAIGVALIMSLGQKANTGSWVGYEILTASGVGLSLQIPLLANQAAVSAADVTTVTAVTLFSEDVGATLFVAASDAAFTNGLLLGLRDFAQDVDPKAAVNAGATQLRHMFSTEQLPGILKAYLQGCTTSYKVSLACAMAALAVSLVNSGPSGFRYLRKRPEEQS